MLTFVAGGLVIAGVLIQIGALVPIRQLITQLPSGRVRRQWYVLAALTLGFIVGYLVYAGASWGRSVDLPGLIVPAVFFFGACFVGLVSTLSLNTILDVRRVTLLEQENITDPLVGIYNRRYLERRLEEEFARARRYGLPLTVFLLDIDHFKSINDTHGHQIGDLALSYVGKLTLDVVRASDIVARFGGEEFMVIGPNTQTSLANTLAERLRQHIESHALVVTGKSNQRLEIRITVSIGVAGLGKDVESVQTLVRHVDEAMYRAKREGRNRVVVHTTQAPKSTAS